MSSTMESVLSVVREHPGSTTREIKKLLPHIGQSTIAWALATGSKRGGGLSKVGERRPHKYYIAGQAEKVDEYRHLRFCT